MTDEPDAEDLVIVATVRLLTLFGYPPGRRWPQGVADCLRDMRAAVEHAAAEKIRAAAVDQLHVANKRGAMEEASALIEPTETT